MNAQKDTTAGSLHTATQAEWPHKPKGPVGQFIQDIKEYEGEEVHRKRPEDGYNPLPDSILPKAKAWEVLSSNLEWWDGNLWSIHQIADSDSNYAEIRKSIEHTSSQVSMIFNNMASHKPYRNNPTTIINKTDGKNDTIRNIDITGIGLKLHIPTIEPKIWWYGTQWVIYIRKEDDIYELKLPKEIHFANNDHKGRFKTIAGLLVDQASGILSKEEIAKLEQWSE